ncbi:MAG: phosphodiester glycosidase family protein [Flavobacterium sp.]|uniref:phosphodiester glycosidase family protein n=1 Tax=Flavobacterium sp. TaxID=239 RepID=UPI002B4663FC|nr:phosphodiester glycosidase family protein [Flavobacterium sp.]WRH72480.1 MAG: phosphodiester glycosidase family protein [Flavobacterium sp.]
MSKKGTFIILLIIATISVGFYQFGKPANEDDRFVSYIVNPKKQNLEFFWKNKKEEHFKNAENLISWLKSKNKKLLFSTNGGMYKKDNSPQGLYVENTITKSEIETSNGKGNFYLKPNGVFYLTTDKNPMICKTENFLSNEKIKYATQSGPMLVIDGEIHTAFKKNSTNLNIRNGVGILPNNQIIFAISKKEINFYDFAEYFKKLGCKNALYLDGFVSRTYLPEKNWNQIDGNFGVIIGVTE